MNAKDLLVLGAACAVIGFSAGCGKKEAEAEAPVDNAEVAAEPEAVATAPAAEPAPAPGLPGAAAVHQSLARKDYQGAVGQLVAMQGSVRREQWEQYIALQYEVRDALMVASESDPKAAQALLALNAFNRGR